MAGMRQSYLINSHIFKTHAYIYTKLYVISCQIILPLAGRQRDMETINTKTLSERDTTNEVILVPRLRAQPFQVLFPRLRDEVPRQVRIEILEGIHQNVS